MSSDSSVRSAPLDITALSDASRTISAQSLSCFFSGTVDDSVSYQPTRTHTTKILSQFSGGEHQQQQGQNGDSFTTDGAGTTTTCADNDQRSAASPASSSCCCASDWHLGEKLGEGGFGSVWLGYRKSDPEKSLRAIKIARHATTISNLHQLPSPPSGGGGDAAAAAAAAASAGGGGGTVPSSAGISATTGGELDNEIELLLLLPSHPNIVQPLFYTTFPGGTQLVMEYCKGGSLSDYLERHGPMPEQRAREYTRQILIGLAFLHRAGVLHQDIKPQNIMFLDESHTQLKLGDFGLSSTAQSRQESSLPLGGTLRYMAPDLICQGESTPASDLWSLGATLTQLLSGVKPWSDRLSKKEQADFWSLRSLITTIPLDEQERKNHHPTIPQDLSEDGKSFLLQLLQLDPQERGTAQQLLTHPWLQTEEASKRTIDMDVSSTNASSSSRGNSPNHPSSSSPSTTDFDSQLLADSIHHVELQPWDAKLWSCVGRLMAPGETATITGYQYSRRQCLLKACITEPHRVLWWNMLGRDLNLLGRDLKKEYAATAALNNNKPPSPVVARGAGAGGNGPSSPMKPKPATVKLEDGDERGRELEVDATYCFVKCLEVNPKSSVGWRNLGLTLNPPHNTTATVCGESYNKQQCYLRAVKLDEKQSASWTNLGTTLQQNESVVIGDKTYNKIECFVNAILLDVSSGAAWGNLGNQLRTNDSVQVGQRKVTKLACQISAVTFHSAPQHWNNLAAALPPGGECQVAGRTVNKLKCLLTALALDSQNAARWRALGYAMGKENATTLHFEHSTGSLDVSRKDCYSKACSLQEHFAIRWSELGAILEDSSEETAVVNGVAYNKIQCLTRAASLDYSDSISLYNLSQLLAPGTSVEINGKPHTPEDFRARLLHLQSEFMKKVDDFCGAKVTDHDRIYQCEKGHALLPHKSLTWRCDYCRGRDPEAGSMSCRYCDLDFCYRDFKSFLDGIEKFPQETSMGPTQSLGGGAEPSFGTRTTSYTSVLDRHISASSNAASASASASAAAAVAAGSSSSSSSSSPSPGRTVTVATEASSPASKAVAAVMGDFIRNSTTATEEPASAPSPTQSSTSSRGAGKEREEEEESLKECTASDGEGDDLSPPPSLTTTPPMSRDGSVQIKDDEASNAAMKSVD